MRDAKIEEKREKWAMSSHTEWLKELISELSSEAKEKIKEEMDKRMDHDFDTNWAQHAVFCLEGKQFIISNYLPPYIHCVLYYPPNPNHTNPFELFKRKFPF